MVSNVAQAYVEVHKSSKYPVKILRIAVDQLTEEILDRKAFIACFRYVEGQYASPL